MLLSQRIAKNPNFLDVLPGDIYSAFELRMKILRAPKFIVGHEFLDMSISPDGKSASMADTLNISSTHALKERAKRWATYSKLPYEAVFIENDTGGIYAETLGGNEFLCIEIYAAGHVIMAHAHCHRMEVEGESVFVSDLYIHSDQYREYVGDSEESLNAVTIAAAHMGSAVAEVLLFLNAANVVTQHYIPSKRENQMVAKPFLPFYTYHVLDIFRTRKHYTSLADITDALMQEASEARERRAHMVRGHFKRWKGKLVWWSAHMRCRKNAETLGVVNKDYALQEDPESIH